MMREKWTCGTQTTSKLIDYLDTDRSCGAPFGGRNSSKREFGALADKQQQDFFCVHLQTKFGRP
jgi:hypothetical protein